MTEGAIHSSTNTRGIAQFSKRLWLVRHGLTDWNVQQRFCGHTDIPLSAQGQVQALWTAERLQKESFCAIYTSDLVRAHTTAEIIASQRISEVQIKQSAEWREMDFGKWEGLTYTKIAEQFKDHLGFFTDPEQHTPPNGESLAHMQQRVINAFSTIIHSDELLSGNAVIVSHGGPLRILLCSLLGIPLRRQWQIKLDPGSLSAIDLLPDYRSSEPCAILGLLNVQISAPESHVTHSQRSSNTT